jgi:hypothetical protein
MRASNNQFYVTKFQNTPQDVRILTNEYLGTKLAAHLGLPVPEVAVIDVAEWLIENSPELKIENAGVFASCASGLQFGSRYVADPLRTAVYDYLPDTMTRKIENVGDFARALAFDKWTGNSDGRQAVFVKGPNHRLYQAVFIDQGHCFNAESWDFPDAPLRGVFARNLVYAGVTGWQSFEPVLSRIEQIDIPAIWNIAREIPHDWYRRDQSALARLVQRLYDRTVLVRNLITTFRRSSRNPFPGWTGD